MSKARSEELRLVGEQATELLLRSATTPDQRNERLKWLMESSLHIREAFAAMAWDAELP